MKLISVHIMKLAHNKIVSLQTLSTDLLSFPQVFHLHAIKIFWPSFPSCFSKAWSTQPSLFKLLGMQVVTVLITVTAVMEWVPWQLSLEIFKIFRNSIDKNSNLDEIQEPMRTQHLLSHLCLETLLCRQTPVHSSFRMI